MSEDRTTIELTLRLEAIVAEIGGFTKTHVSYPGADFDGLSENDILAAAWPALRKHQVLTLPSTIGHDIVERIKIDKAGKEILERFIIVRLGVTFRAVGTEEFVTLYCEGMAVLQDDKALSKATSDANKNLWKKLTQAYAKPSVQRGNNRTANTRDQQPASRANQPSARISQSQAKRLWTIARDLAWSETAVRDLLGRHGFEHTEEITISAYPKIIEALQTAKESK